MSSIGVVHLVWVPLGPEPLAAFVRSYRRFPGGVGHRMVVVVNGARDEAELAPFRPLLDALDCPVMRTPHPVQDIPAYYTAARGLSCDRLCFLNSYSVLLDPEWLAKLDGALATPGVGLVGATGSWESQYSGLRDDCPSPAGYVRWVAGRWMRGLPRPGVRNYLAQRGEVRRARGRFAPFPNPHVRTNAFMLGRELMLRLDPGTVASKTDALAFESGRGGLTRRVEAEGLAIRVVGADGHAYPPDAWPRSRTFRSGMQENLMVADNRTRQYAEADPATRAALARLAWGEA